MSINPANWKEDHIGWSMEGSIAPEHLYWDDSTSINAEHRSLPFSHGITPGTSEPLNYLDPVYDWSNAGHVDAAVQQHTGPILTTAMLPGVEPNQLMSRNTLLDSRVVDTDIDGYSHEQNMLEMDIPQSEIDNRPQGELSLDHTVSRCVSIQKAGAMYLAEWQNTTTPCSDAQWLMPLQERYSATGQEHFQFTSVPLTFFSGNVHHHFLDFLMRNIDLLRLVDTSSDSQTSMTNIQYAFENEFMRDGFVPPFSDIARIFQLFRPVIGSFAGRQERDTKRTQKTRVNCPFQFCGSPFTRGSGLRNHLAAHFRLAPRQCCYCGKALSDASHKRHEDNCASQRPNYSSISRAET